MANIEVWTITPERAARILERNYDGQRCVRDTVVSKYALDMSCGLWNENTVQPIMVTSDGTLIDGQHRLKAVVKSGKTVKFHVVTDASIDDYKYIDCGETRKAKDFINSSYSNEIAALSKLCACTEQGTTRIKSIVQGWVDNGNCKKVQASRNMVVDYANGDIQHLRYYCKTASRIRGEVGVGAISIYSYFLWLVDWLGTGDCIDSFVSDFMAEDGTRGITSNLKIYMMKRLGDKSRKTSKDQLLGILLIGYERFKEGDKVSSKSFGHIDKTLNRYSDMIEEKRTKLALELEG